MAQTGLSISLLTGVYARVTPRSGLALKKFTDVGVGIIDNDYRGELRVILFNHSDDDWKVNEGDRAAQLILERIKTSIVQKAQDLDERIEVLEDLGVLV